MAERDCRWMRQRLRGSLSIAIGMGRLMLQVAMCLTRSMPARLQRLAAPNGEPTVCSG